MWAVCDVAMGLVMSKTTNYEMKEYPTMPRVPPMYFKKHDDPNFVNSMVFVPQEFTVSHMKKNVMATTSNTRKGRKTANANVSPNNSIDVVRHNVYNGSETDMIAHCTRVIQGGCKALTKNMSYLVVTTMVLFVIKVNYFAGVDMLVSN